MAEADDLTTSRHSEILEQLAKTHADLLVAASTVHGARKSALRAKATQAERDALDTAEQRVIVVHEQLGVLLKQAEAMSGLPDEFFAALDELERGPILPLAPRDSMASDQVPPSGDLRELVGPAVEALLHLVPHAVRQQAQERATEFRLAARPGEPAVLLKGLAIASLDESRQGMAQALTVARDFLDQRADYDAYAGATILPRIVAFGARAQDLQARVPGAKDRLGRLMSRPSEFESTLYELLVAGAFLGRDRGVRFIREDHEPRPDIETTDTPIPLLIECKLRRRFSEYDLKEGAWAADLLRALRSAVLKRRMVGIFDIDLVEDFSKVTPPTIVEAALRQKFAINTREPVAYSWGHIAWTPVPERIPLVGHPDSPTQLRDMLGWVADLPEYDGVAYAYDIRAVSDQLQDVVAVRWVNNSTTSLRRRTDAPLGLVADALKKYHPGDIGMFFVGYEEGARAKFADARTEELVRRIQAWEHDSKIRVPLGIVSRFYPRAMPEGPDFIENPICITSEAYGNLEAWATLPTVVVTPDTRPVDAFRNVLGARR